MDINTVRRRKMENPFSPIGYSRGSPCCICGQEVGGHSAINPFDAKAVFLSQGGKIYCGDCAVKHNVGIFSRFGAEKMKKAQD